MLLFLGDAHLLLEPQQWHWDSCSWFGGDTKPPGPPVLAALPRVAGGGLITPWAVINVVEAQALPGGFCRAWSLLSDCEKLRSMRYRGSLAEPCLGAGLGALERKRPARRRQEAAQHQAQMHREDVPEQEPGAPRGAAEGSCQKGEQNGRIWDTRGTRQVPTDTARSAQCHRSSSGLLF